MPGMGRLKRFSRTKAINLVGFLVTGLAVIFHFSFTDAQVGAIALLVWSVANQLFTEGGSWDPRKWEFNATTVVNALGAAIAIGGSAGWLHLASGTVTQVLMLASQAANLFTEGGIGQGDGDGQSTVAAALIGLSLAAVVTTTSCATGQPLGLPTPESIVSVQKANEALVKAQAVRVLARDTIASAVVAKVPGADKAAEVFDVGDRIFTEGYRRCRLAIAAGDLERFRQVYGVLRDVSIKLADLAQGDRPEGGQQ
jgi:hypothetical protein